MKCDGKSMLTCKEITETVLQEFLIIIAEKKKKKRLLPTEKKGLYKSNIRGL